MLTNLSLVCPEKSCREYRAEQKSPGIGVCGECGAVLKPLKDVTDVWSFSSALTTPIGSVAELVQRSKKVMRATAKNRA